MLKVSEKYKTMAESDTREVSVKVVMGETVLTNDDIIELNIYRSTGESGFSIGGAVTTRVRLLCVMKLPYSGEVAMDVFVRFGFDEKTASDYVQLGHFYGHASNPSHKTAQVEIIGYDKLGASDFNSRCTFAKVGNAELTFPCTVQEMLQYVCQRRNLESEFQCLDYTVSEMPVKDKSKDNSDYEKYYTYKEIIGFIAAAHGASAAIDSEGKLVFLSAKESEEEVNKSDCIDFALTSAEKFTVKGILFHVQNVLSTGSTNIFINDDSKTAYDGEISEGVVETSCPFGSIEIAEALWGQLGGFSYNSCEFMRRGRGWTELGDIITAVDDLREKINGEYISRNMIAQTVEWSFSADSGFMEHIISKAGNSEESAERLGTSNAIKTVSENSETIKFIRDGTQYGAAGIHDIDGETGVALSIAEASNWLALIDENGEKILEYVPCKKDEDKPYEVENGIWFFPVQSQKVPSFNGFYFPYPTQFPKNSFTISDANDNTSIFYGFYNSTVFCSSQEYADKYKTAGFKNAVDGSKFDGDIWQINGTAFNVVFRQDTYSNATILGLENDDIFVNLGNAPKGNGVGIFICAPYLPEYENGEITAYSTVQRGGMVMVGDTMFYMNSYAGVKYSVNGDAFISVWKSFTDALSDENSSSEEQKSGIRIYKNIVLMNGAKILNEDGTEHTT